MSSKVRNLPQGVKMNGDLIQEALDLGCSKAKIIPTKTIALGHWLRMQCQFGCPHFGKSLACPPFTPMVDEVSDILTEYKKAVLVKTDQPDQIAEIVIALEESLKQKGYAKAFGLGSKPCTLCETCSVEASCEHPSKARPTLRAFGIDVSQTTSNNGWESDSAIDYCENNPIGLVLID